MIERRSREPLPDALRALALVGVLLVNVLGYRDVPYGRLLGQAVPPDSAWAHVATFLVAAFVQGKAYPLLALLFGMGLAYAARGRTTASAIVAADRRNRRLLALGVAHGVLLYYGDILTLYALCGFWVARQMRDPWRVLRRRLRFTLGWAVAAVGASLALARAPLGGPASLQTIGTAPDYGAFFSLNATSYLFGVLFGLLLALPLVRLAMLAGVAVVRLRLLTHRRWRSRVRSALHRWAVPVVAANLAYGWAYVHVSDLRGVAALESASALWSVPLSLCYLALGPVAWQAGARRCMSWLVPLGQHTLTVYVASSLLMLCVLSGAGLAWRPSTALAAASALALWALAAVASRWLPGRWPLEAWMARR